MTTFDRINRRTHLYIGLFLMPWLLMYGVSSFIVIHRSRFRSDKEPVWEKLFEKEYSRSIDGLTRKKTSAVPRRNTEGLQFGRRFLG